MQTKRSRFNRKLLASAVTMAALGLGVAGNAQAAAYAYAENQLSNFTITSTADYLVGDSSRLTSTSAAFTGDPSGSAHEHGVLLGNESDALQSTSGKGPFPVENFWARALEAGSGARGDAYTAAGSPFGPGGVPNVLSVAEARSSNEGSGTGRATNSAGAKITVVVLNAGTFTFSFSTDSLWDIIAKTEKAGETATAKVADSFSITDAKDNQVFDWTPVNELVGSVGGTPPSTGLNDKNSYETTTQELAPGTYSFILNATSYADVISPVPEPASMALIGLGLLGLAATRRRKFRV